MTHQPFTPLGIAVKKGDTVRLGAAGGVGLTTQPLLKLSLNLTSPDGNVDAQSTVPLVLTGSRTTSAVTTPQFTDKAFITSASINQLSGSAILQPGIVYVSAFLNRAGDDVAQIFGGYFYRSHSPSYPALAIQGLFDGPGKVYNVHTASTALLAAGVSFGPPASARWRVSNLAVKLVTSASVGTRTILVYMTDGTTAPVSGTEGANAIVEWVNSGTFGTGRNVVASTTERYQIGGFQTVDASSTINKIIQTPFLVQDTMSIFVQDTAHIDAALDAVTIDATVEEWLSG